MKLSPNCIPNWISKWIPKDFTCDLPNDYQANGYSTEAVNLDGHGEVNQERTETIIHMTFTEKRSTETLPDVESREAEICICNVLSGFPRAEARSYHGENDYPLLWLRVRYRSMIYLARSMQLASIGPPLRGHRECNMRTTLMMRGGEAHIAVQSQDEIHMMIDYSLDHSSQCRRWSMPRLKVTKWRTNLITCRITERLQLHFQITNQSQLQFGDPRYTATNPQWQSTIDIMMKSFMEERIFNEGDSRVCMIKFYRQVKAHTKEVSQDIEKSSSKSTKRT